MNGDAPRRRRDRGEDAIERILGPGAASSDAHCLLGIATGRAEPTENEVVAALESRLAEVARHQLGATPEADEVRLALHAAAARLLHHVGGPHSPIRAGHGPTQDAPHTAPRSPSAIAPEVLDAAIAAVAMSGGLNAGSLRQIAAIAAMHGVDFASLAGAVESRLVASAHASRNAPSPAPAAITSPPPRPPVRQPSFPSATGGDPVAVPTYEDPGAAATRRVLFVALALVGGGGLVLFAAIIAVMTFFSGPSKTPPGAPPGPATSATPSAPPRSADAGTLFPQATESQPSGRPADIRAAKPPPVDADKHLRDLAASVRAIATDPTAAQTAMTQTCDALAAIWPTLTPDQLAAAQDSIVEFVYRCSALPEVSQRAVQSIGSHAAGLSAAAAPPKAADILPGIWSVGMLTRLARERDLPAIARSQVQAELASTLDGILAGRSGSFSVGISSAIGATVRLLLKPAPTPPIDAWMQWIEAAASPAAGDETARERSLIAAIDALILDGPEPLEAAGLAPVVETIVEQLNWRPNDASRHWLLDCFAAPTVTWADLRLVTRALAEKSSAEGVDVSMVLPAAGDDRTRAELRDRYAAAWGLTQPVSRDELAASWTRAAKDRIAVATDRSEPARLALMRSATLARLNTAAMLLWAGADDQSAKLLEKLDEAGALVASSAADQAKPLDDGATDGSWGLQYLAAGARVGDRIRLLQELSRTGAKLGRVDADVLVSDAVRGSPSQVRYAAREAVLQFAQSPAVVHSLLEESPRMAKTNDNADLVMRISLGRLPALADPSWRPTVRRLLVERLLEMLASTGEDAVIDRLADAISREYDARVAGAPGGAARPATDANGKQPPARSPVETSAAHRAVWERAAAAATPTGREPESLDRIRRRAAGRDAVADGLVQQFAANQVAAFELMALVVANEMPPRSADVKAVLEKVNADRRGADHIFRQIESVERGMAQLWLIRMGGAES